MKKKGKLGLALCLTLAMVTGTVGCGQQGQETQAPQGSDRENQDDREKQESMAGQYFIKGADISSLEAVEDYGGVFYDFEGNQVDPVRFLIDNGCNYFRLRIWNNPTRSFDAGDYCNLEHTLIMAKRIKEAGGDYLLDFHYSDWWADPNSQTVPAAWQGMSEEELIQAVYDYTAEVLTALEEEEAYPDMVQVGNEIANGMLWDYGSTDHPQTLAALLNSGISAVRDTTPEGQETQIMIHVQDGGSVGATQAFFEMLEANGVTDYDIVGLSYYPYWHGTFADVKANIENIYNKFGKQVVLAETAYPFTYDNADNKENLVREAEVKAVGFEASEENQRLVLELIMNTVATTQGGLGIFYWEPVWLAVEGVGVAKGSGNEWENQALFDYEGNALEAIKAFAYVPGSLDNDQALYVYPFSNVEIDESATGDELYGELPENARVLFMDGSIRDIPVEWDLDSRKEITATRIAFRGTALDFEVSMGADLIDKYSLNNMDFEDGTGGWVEIDEKSAGQICNDGNSYPHSGAWSYQYWSADNFDIDLYQMVRITSTDQYNLQVWSQGIEKSELLITLYIADNSGNTLASTDFTNDGWAVWQHPLVSAQLNEGDVVRIGVHIQGTSDDWGTLDEFSFYPGEAGAVIDTAAGMGSEPGTDNTTAMDGNLLENASMESGDSGWTITREETVAGTIRNDSEGNPHSGDYSFHYWDESDFTIDLAQTVTVNATGSYCLSAFSQGDGDTETYLTLYLLDGNGNVLHSKDWSNIGWDMWQNPTIEGISLESGQTVTVGITIHGKANGWGTLDDISLVIEK